MVTGSVASSLQGEPRATHDIDIVLSQVSGARTKREVVDFACGSWCRGGVRIARCDV